MALQRGLQKASKLLAAEVKSTLNGTGAEAAFRGTGRIEFNSIYQNKGTRAPGEGLQRWPFNAAPAAVASGAGRPKTPR